jgi:hypothetical protein
MTLLLLLLSGVANKISCIMLYSYRRLVCMPAKNSFSGP